MATNVGNLDGISDYYYPSSESSVWTSWTRPTGSCVWEIWIGEGTNNTTDDQESPTTIFDAPSPLPQEEIRIPQEEIRRHRLEDARSRGILKRGTNERLKAEDRAKKLLMDLIGKSDYKKFLQLGYLDVGGNSGRTYRIRTGHEIEVREGDIKVESLCIMTPDCHLPGCDEIVWRKLLVEGNEELLLEVANHS